MKMTMIGLLLIVATIGCSDECDEANDVLEQCGLDPVFNDGECSEKDACIADCVRGSSCESIDSGDSTNYYHNCLASC